MTSLNISHLEGDFWSSRPFEECSAGRLIIQEKAVQLRSAIGGQIIREFLCESAPLAAVFFPSRIEDKNADPVVAILVSSTLLRFHTNEGQTYELVLNFAAKTVFSSSLGVIVERESNSSKMCLYSPNDPKFWIYSVTSPDGLIRPVLCPKLWTDESTNNHEEDNDNSIESDEFKRVVITCIWHKYICFYDEHSRNLSVHFFLPKNHSSEEHSNSIEDSFGHLSDNSLSVTKSDNLPLNASGISDSKSDLSGLGTVQSNSTGFRSLRRRPRKQHRPNSTISDIMLHDARKEMHSKLISTRSSSPVSFGQHTFVPFATSVPRNDYKGSFFQDSKLTEERELFPFLSNNSNTSDHLPPDFCIGPAIASIKFSDEAKISYDSFTSSYSSSFSLSPSGNILFHLLCHRHSVLYTYLLSSGGYDTGKCLLKKDSICSCMSRRHNEDSFMSNSHFILLAVRNSVTSIAHVALGRLKKIKTSRHMCSEPKMFDFEAKNERLGFGAVDCEDVVGTLLYSNEGECTLVVGSSPPVYDFNFNSIASNDTLKEFFGVPSSCDEKNNVQLLAHTIQHWQSCQKDATDVDICPKFRSDVTHLATCSDGTAIISNFSVSWLFLTKIISDLDADPGTSDLLGFSLTSGSVCFALLRVLTSFVRRGLSTIEDCMMKSKKLSTMFHLELVEFLSAILKFLMSLVAVMGRTAADVLCVPFLLTSLSSVNTVSENVSSNENEIVNQIIGSVRKLLNVVGDDMRDRFDGVFLDNSDSLHNSVLLLHSTLRLLDSDLSSFLLSLIHLILEDQYLAGLGSSKCTTNTPFKVAPDSHAIYSPATRSAALSVYCYLLLNSSGSPSLQSCVLYYRRLSSAMNINDLAIRDFMLCYPFQANSRRSSGSVFLSAEKLVPSSLHWLQASLRSCSPSQSKHNVPMNPFSDMLTALLSQGCFLDSSFSENNEPLASLNDQASNCLMSSCDDLNSILLEVALLAMPRFCLLRSFLVDLTWRIRQPLDQDPGMGHFQHCICASFLRCCLFAKDYLGESSGCSVLDVLPFSLKILVETAICNVRNCLVESESIHNYFFQQHTCRKCPFNQCNWLGKCVDRSECCCQPGVDEEVRKRLEWPIDVLSLAGREDFIANYRYSAISLFWRDYVMNPFVSAPHARNSSLRSRILDRFIPNASSQRQRLQESDEMLLSCLPFHPQQSDSDILEDDGFWVDVILQTSDGLKSSENKKSKGADSDGLLFVERMSISRFAEDERMKEACRLLRSSKVISLRVERSPEDTDISHRLKQQGRLLSMCRRSLALSVGRGMLSYSSLDPLMAEHLPIPPLELRGKVPPINSIISLEPASAPPELTLWPEFHNGVAAGLRVRGGRKGSSQRSGASTSSTSVNYGSVTRNWILYNRHNCCSKHDESNEADISAMAMENAHAGSLMAFGLLGHLNVLNRSDITDYLTRNHEPTSIALLIGLAASKFGSADPLISRTLCIHLPSLLYPTTTGGTPLNFATFQALNQGGGIAHVVSPLVQSAALTGLGLLHCRTAHRLTVEFLMSELISEPGATNGNGQPECREALAMSAGWALGMVLLGKGNCKKHKGTSGEGESTINSDPLALTNDDVTDCLTDLRLEDRLHQCVEGGRKESLCESKLFSGSKRLMKPQWNSVGGDAGDDAMSRSSRSLETDFININIAAPGAIIALTLMYLKTNNADVALRMGVPHTVFALDNIRPDMLIFRTMSVCLIMWDSVVPSIEWLRTKSPVILLQDLFIAPLAQASVRGAAESSSSPREANDKKRYYSKLPSNTRNRQMPLRASFQAYICAMAGLSWGLALRYAGTSNRETKQLLLAQLRFLQCLRDGEVPPVEAVEFLCENDQSFSSLRLLFDAKSGCKSKKYSSVFQPFLRVASDKSSKPTLETCVTLTAMSAAVVMAGSGDLDTLTILRMLRSKIDDTGYGTHLGIGMAIGYLFLGQGKCSLRRDSVSIGALLMSMTPLYPSRTSDNQNHLQALRHLYVLAMEERCLSTTDVDTNQSVSVDVNVSLRSGSVLRIRSPTLLPELSTVVSISTCSQEYFESSIEFTSQGCAICNVSMLNEYLKTENNSVTESSSSQLDSQMPSIDLNRLHRCPNCPQATVLYVKRKKTAMDSHSDQFAPSFEGLSDAQRTETFCAGSAALSSAVCWLNDQMSLTSRQRSNNMIGRYNPFLADSAIEREISVQCSSLHSLLSISSPHPFMIQKSCDNEVVLLESLVEISILRAWEDYFTKLPDDCCYERKTIRPKQILLSSEDKIAWYSFKLIEDSPLDTAESVVECFRSYISTSDSFAKCHISADLTQLKMLFSMLLFGWGIPLNFLLLPQIEESDNKYLFNIQEFIDERIRHLRDQGRAADKKAEWRKAYLEIDAICRYLSCMTAN